MATYVRMKILPLAGLPGTSEMAAIRALTPAGVGGVVRELPPFELVNPSYGQWIGKGYPYVEVEAWSGGGVGSNYTSVSPHASHTGGGGGGGGGYARWVIPAAMGCDLGIVMSSGTDHIGRRGDGIGDSARRGNAAGVYLRPGGGAWMAAIILGGEPGAECEPMGGTTAGGAGGTWSTEFYGMPNLEPVYWAAGQPGASGTMAGGGAGGAGAGPDAGAGGAGGGPCSAGGDGGDRGGGSGGIGPCAETLGQWRATGNAGRTYLIVRYPRKYT
jgi:hypothetical protein